jgi:hypothetical protein
MGDAKSIERTLRVIVALLVKKDYAELESVTRGVRLSAAEIATAVRDYGRTLVFPPAAAFSQADVIPIRGSVPPAYSVRFHLHTQEEGSSDLEIQATFREDSEDEMLNVELDNIIVA